MEIEKFIKVYNGGMKIEAVGSLVYFLSKKTSFQDATIVGSKSRGTLDKKIRDTKTYNFEDGSYTGIHWGSFLRHLISNYYFEYLKGNKANASDIITLEALKYEVGGHYVPHVDHGAKVPRTVSSILFLNNDYEGGEINFHDPCDYNKIYKTIKPAPGRCLLWPSNFIYPHSVSPVTKGTRYVIVSWLI